MLEIPVNYKAVTLNIFETISLQTEQLKNTSAKHPRVLLCKQCNRTACYLRKFIVTFLQ